MNEIKIMKVSELATRGLEIERFDSDGRTALIITDGQMAWDCWEDDYLAAVSELESEEINPDQDEAERIAYDRLCDLVPYLAHSRSMADVLTHEEIAEEYRYNWS